MALAVITLGLGVGLSAGAFTVTRWVVWRPLAAFRHSRRVVLGDMALLPGDAYAVGRQHSVFEQTATYSSRFPSAVDRDGKTILLYVAAISPGFFRLLGVTPQVGRGFLPGEYEPGRDTEAILSYAFWRRRYRSDHRILGKSINLGGRDYTVVGVMPEWFRFRFSGQATPYDVWVPLALTRTELSERGEPKVDLDGELASGSREPVQIIGRLRTGVSLARANRELHALASTMVAEHPADEYVARELKFIDPGGQWYAQAGKGTLWPLLATSCLLLLTAAANFTALAAVEGISRSREMALREALGANRLQLFRLILSESFLVGLMGAGLALLAAFGVIQLFRGLAPSGNVAPGATIPRLGGVQVDAWTVGFALAAVVFIAIVASLLATAINSRRALPIALRQWGSGGQRVISRNGSGRARAFLAAAQVAVATVLLVAAGLAGRGLSAVGRVSPGFQYRRVLVGSLRPGDPAGAATTQGQLQETFSRLLEALEASPGISSAGLASAVFPYWPGTVRFDVGDLAKTRRFVGSAAWWQRVTNGYFTALQIPLLEGRLFSQNPSGYAMEVIVNRSLASEFFPGGAVGQTLRIEPPSAYSEGGPSRQRWMGEIVGVVGDVRAGGLERPVRPEIYTDFMSAPVAGPYIVVKTVLPPVEVSRRVQTFLAGIDRQIVATDLNAFRAQIEADLAPQRFVAALNGVFALAAIALDVIGLYGLLAFVVAHRTPEIAVRRALGARDGQILASVLGGSLLAALIGVGIGALTAAALAQLVRAWFYGVSAVDPETYLAVVTTVFATSLASAYFPAMRALRVAPAVALHEE